MTEPSSRCPPPPDPPKVPCTRASFQALSPLASHHIQTRWQEKKRDLPWTLTADAVPLSSIRGTAWLMERHCACILLALVLTLSAWNTSEGYAVAKCFAADLFNAWMPFCSFRATRSSGPQHYKQNFSAAPQSPNRTAADA